MASPARIESFVTAGPGPRPADGPAEQTGSAGQESSRAGFEMLLQTESEARRATTVGELEFLAANDTMTLCRARQVFVTTATSRPRVRQVSSIGRIDQDSPRIRWVEAVLRSLAADAGLGSRRAFVLPAYCPPDQNEQDAYPFRFMLWVPLVTRKGVPFAGMLLARETPWNEQDELISARLAETYAHAWLALTGKPPAIRRVRPSLFALAIAGLVAGVGFIPVPLTVLAPTEVTSIDPRVVAAPMDGAIEQILVTPNQAIREGQPLVRLSATTLRNELAVAERNIGVAEARLKQVMQSSVGDASMRAELAIARSELALAEAKRNYARDMLERTEIVAPSAGVAVFSDPRDWSGRPVSTGERIMEIADPNRLELRIDLPVADAIALRQGARVRAFLDSDPLKPLDAQVRSVSFEAQTVENNSIAYRIYASLAGGASPTRLGTRGTAQVYGDRVPLAFYVFRRPVAAMRQWLGI